GNGRAALAGPLAWPQRWKRQDLLPNIGRDVQQEPGAAIGADGQRRLGAWPNHGRAGADGDTVRAAAVPLLHPAAGRRAENADVHVSDRSAESQRSVLG